LNQAISWSVTAMASSSCRSSRAQAVLAKLADVRAAEVSLEAKVKAGLEIPDFVSALINSDRAA
jgi:hypothetical protein